jgi:hypothetical protein
MVCGSIADALLNYLVWYNFLNLVYIFYVEFVLMILNIFSVFIHNPLENIILIIGAIVANLNLYTELQSNIDFFFSICRVPRLDLNKWHWWKKKHRFAMANFWILLRSQPIADQMTTSYFWYEPIYIFRGDSWNFLNLSYYIKLTKLFWSNKIKMSNFIIINDYMFPFLFRKVKLSIFFYYFVVVLILKSVFSKGETYEYNSIYLWKKIRETFDFYKINSILTEGKVEMELKAKKGSPISLGAVELYYNFIDINKLILRRTFKEFYFFYLNIKVKTITKIWNLLLLKKKRKRNISFLEEKMNIIRNNYMDIYKNYVYGVKSNFINKKNDLIKNIFTYYNHYFYKEYLYRNNSEFNSYLKSKKYSDFMDLWNNKYNRLLIFLKLNYQKNIYIYNLYNAQEELEEVVYFFTTFPNLTSKRRLIKKHKRFSLKIISYFDWIDLNIFNNKGFSWLLNKNLYTLFFNKTPVTEVLWVQIEAPGLEFMFIWVYAVPFLILTMIYFQTYSFEFIFPVFLNMLLIYMNMFLDNNDVLYRLYISLLHPLVNTIKGVSGYISTSDIAEDELELPKHLSASKVYYFSYLFKYKGLYYLNNNWHCWKLTIFNPCNDIISYKIMWFYYFQLIFILFIIFILFLKFFGRCKILENILNICYNYLEFKNFNIEFKVIISLYKHFTFLFNKKKVLKVIKGLKF